MEDCKYLLAVQGGKDKAALGVRGGNGKAAGDTGRRRGRLCGPGRRGDFGGRGALPEAAGPKRGQLRAGAGTPLREKIAPKCKDFMDKWGRLLSFCFPVRYNMIVLLSRFRRTKCSVLSVINARCAASPPNTWWSTASPIDLPTAKRQGTPWRFVLPWPVKG